MRKRDFMDLDNPLLAWMLDYDAVSACLRVGAAPPRDSACPAAFASARCRSTMDHAPCTIHHAPSHVTLLA